MRIGMHIMRQKSSMKFHVTPRIGAPSAAHHPSSVKLPVSDVADCFCMMPHIALNNTIWCVSIASLLEYCILHQTMSTKPWVMGEAVFVNRVSATQAYKTKETVWSVLNGTPMCTMLAIRSTGLLDDEYQKHEWIGLVETMTLRFSRASRIDDFSMGSAVFSASRRVRTP